MPVEFCYPDGRLRSVDTNNGGPLRGKRFCENAATTANVQYPFSRQVNPVYDVTNPQWINRM